MSNTEEKQPRLSKKRVKQNTPFSIMFGVAIDLTLLYTRSSIKTDRDFGIYATTAKILINREMSKVSESAYDFKNNTKLLYGALQLVSGATGSDRQYTSACLKFIGTSNTLGERSKGKTYVYSRPVDTKS